MSPSRHIKTILNKKNKNGLRILSVAFLAFGPLLFALPATADEVTEPTVIVVTTPGGDDSSYQVPLTTTVTFDGVTYDSVYATTNSVITFGRPDGTYWDYPMTPSISLYSMDWVVFPWARQDEHLVIRASDGGFQVDISARPIWLQNATEPTNINIVAAVNTDGTVAISYSLTGPTYDNATRTGVRLTDGSIVTLEDYGIVQVEEAPVLQPEPVAPTPEPTPEPTPTPTVVPPTIPDGATLLTEGSSLQVVAPEGQRIVSIMAWYGDPADSTRGIDVSSTLTELASGQTSVTIDSSNIYGDPAPGTVKTLIFVVNYEPIPQPTPEPTPETPVVNPPAPEPQPTTQPEPVATPEPEPEPTIDPQPEPELPLPEEPEPLPSEEPVIESASPEPPVIEPEPILPQTEAEVVAELAAEAQADDPELPAELAAIPLVGEALGAVLDVFNDIGNIGADMTPEVREQAEKTVVASIVVGQVASSAAAAAATSAAASTRKIK